MSERTPVDPPGVSSRVVIAPNSSVPLMVSRNPYLKMPQTTYNKVGER